MRVRICFACGGLSMLIERTRAHRNAMLVVVDIATIVCVPCVCMHRHGERIRIPTSFRRITHADHSKKREREKEMKQTDRRPDPHKACVRNEYAGTHIT